MNGYIATIALLIVLGIFRDVRWRRYVDDLIDGLRNDNDKQHQRLRNAETSLEIIYHEFSGHVKRARLPAHLPELSPVLELVPMIPATREAAHVDACAQVH